MLLLSLVTFPLEFYHIFILYSISDIHYYKLEFVWKKLMHEFEIDNRKQHKRNKNNKEITNPEY